MRISLSNRQGAGGLSALTVAGEKLLPFSPAHSSAFNLVNERFHLVANQNPASARRRIGLQAMIETPVRKTKRFLIALHRHFTPYFINPGQRQIGFFEQEPLCFQQSTGEWRTSTRKKPQTYGKASSVLFDVTGLVGWLRERFPRSTIHHVEAETGISSASVDNWLGGRSQPSVEHFTILIAHFGPSLLQACLRRRPEWVDDAAKADRLRQIEAQIAELTGERIKLASGGAA